MRLLCVGYISPSRPQVAAWADRKTGLWWTQSAGGACYCCGAFFQSGGTILADMSPDLLASLHPRHYGNVRTWVAVVSAGPRAPV